MDKFNTYIELTLFRKITTFSNKKHQSAIIKQIPFLRCKGRNKVAKFNGENGKWKEQAAIAYGCISVKHR